MRLHVDAAMDSGRRDRRHEPDEPTRLSTLCSVANVGPKRVRRLRREIRRLAIQLRENRAERRERRLARGVLFLASTTKRLLLLALSSPLLAERRAPMGSAEPTPTLAESERRSSSRSVCSAVMGGATAASASPTFGFFSTPRRRGEGSARRARGTIDERRRPGRVQEREADLKKSSSATSRAAGRGNQGLLRGRAAESDAVTAHTNRAT